MDVSSNVWDFTRAHAFGSNCIYMLASARQLAEDDVASSQVIGWTGEWVTFTPPIIVHFLCMVDVPEPTLICANADSGRVVVARQSGFEEEEIGDVISSPSSYGAIRDVCDINGRVFAVGMGRQVYERTSPGKWNSIAHGMLQSCATNKVVGFNSIAGSAEGQIYAVGWSGEIFQFNGGKWLKEDSPTNLKLQRVSWVDRETIFTCGQAGVLLRARGNHQWEAVDHRATVDDFWGMCWFQDRLFLATKEAIYVLTDNDELEQIPISTPVTCGWLHSDGQVMWSVGREHILSTDDGEDWELLKLPT